MPLAGAPLERMVYTSGSMVYTMDCILYTMFYIIILYTTEYTVYDVDSAPKWFSHVYCSTCD